MSAKRYENSAAIRRSRRVRARVKSTGRLRLSVFRSARHIYAQIIDDAEGKTLAAASSLDKEIKGGGNRESAEAVGKLLGDRASKAGINEVSCPYMAQADGKHESRQLPAQPSAYQNR